MAAMTLAVGRTLPAAVTQPILLMLGMLLWCGSVYFIGRLMWIALGFMFPTMSDSDGPANVALVIVCAIMLTSAASIATALIV